MAIRHVMEMRNGRAMIVEEGVWVERGMSAIVHGEEVSGLRGAAAASVKVGLERRRLHARSTCLYHTASLLTLPRLAALSSDGSPRPIRNIHRKCPHCHTRSNTPT